ncbi:MAG: NAD(P)/FAD-dependent oxidoreductase [Terrimicrobiaceae bacterium]
MIAVIGAGLAGLTCGKVLHEAGADYCVLDSSDAVGGRVRSDRHHGMILDRGFQVLLDSYPTLRRHGNLKTLKLQPFDSGALLWDAGQFWKLRNPFRHPLSAPETAFGQAFPLADKVRLGKIALTALARSDQALLQACGGTHDEETLAFARKNGLSPELIERFLRPFFGGVFLDNRLETSAALFSYYLKKFLLGRALLPGEGIGALPRQLAASLRPGSLRLETRVKSLITRNGHVSGLMFEDGGKIDVASVVLATDAISAKRLVQGDSASADFTPDFAPVWTVSFRAKESLYRDRLIVLPAGRKRLVRHFAQITNVAPGYSSDGSPLVVATILEPGGHASAALATLAKREIAEVFPDAAAGLDVVEILRIDRAVLRQPPDFFHRTRLTSPYPNLILAGDHTATSSIEAAMASGERAAKQAVEPTLV